ncbi:hypothetical protein CDCA_CDCA11G3315 [Cyanidium caldarium]|uniref:Uncharacterized protein n=1 Tax=Cyanidium caldarium TaxID=2771 RepID=A0AAV9IY83_CYACA|nr:hypothetical protein CDCA_CDCA11G3315 [Cyanidium caldarium]
MRTPDSSRRSHRAAVAPAAAPHSVSARARPYDDYASEDSDEMEGEEEAAAAGNARGGYGYGTYGDTMTTAAVGGGVGGFDDDYDSWKGRRTLRVWLRSTIWVVSRLIVQPMMIGASAAFGMSVGYAAFDYAAATLPLGAPWRARLGALAPRADGG